jgi:hypothetical protein
VWMRVMNKIALTDYPKPKHIQVHYRGVETETLVQWYKQLFHLMMVSGSVESGGYTIYYDYKDIEQELKFRKVEVEF